MTLLTIFYWIYDFCLRNRVHFIAWGVFILYDVFITGLIMDRFAQPSVYVIVYIITLSTFYSYTYFLRIASKQKRLVIRLLTIFFIVIFELLLWIVLAITLRYVFTFLNFYVTNAPFVLSYQYVLENIWRCSYFIGFGTGYFYILRSIENRQAVEELKSRSLLDQIERHSLENSLIQTQNNYLRSQINPHFLFNTLNFIYNDARKKAPIAAEAIMSLAEMMRYALKRSEALTVVPILEEITQINHLIDLHQLRTKNAVNLDLNIKGDLAGIRFPPLVLLTLVENMFKHGNVLHASKPAHIKMNHFDHVLEITLCNLIGAANKSDERSEKVGVINTKTRLKNVYKNHCSFNCFVDEIKNTYTTEIVIDLHFHPEKFTY